MPWSMRSLMAGGSMMCTRRLEHQAAHALVHEVPHRAGGSLMCTRRLEHQAAHALVHAHACGHAPGHGQSGAQACSIRFLIWSHGRWKPDVYTTPEGTWHATFGSRTSTSVLAPSLAWPPPQGVTPCYRPPWPSSLAASSASLPSGWQRAAAPLFC